MKTSLVSYLIIVIVAIIPTSIVVSARKVVQHTHPRTRRDLPVNRQRVLKDAEKKDPKKDDAKPKKEPAPKKDDEATSRVMRECKVSTEEKKDDVELKCGSKVKGLNDELRFGVSTGRKGVEIDMKYKFDGSRPGGEKTKIDSSYLIKFERLVEFETVKRASSTGRNGDDNEDDDNTGYGWDEDSVVQEIKLDKFNTFSKAEKDLNNVYKFDVENEDETASFYFKMSEEGKGGLSPNRMKVDIEIKDFEWKGENTALALLSTIESKNKIHTNFNKKDSKKKKKSKEDEDGGEDEQTEHSLIAPRKAIEDSDVNVIFGDVDPQSDIIPVGMYNWVKNAEVDVKGQRANTVEVVATAKPKKSATSTSRASLKGDEKEEIAFTFAGSNGASRIFWDPEIGVEFGTNSTVPIVDENGNIILDDSTIFNATTSGAITMIPRSNFVSFLSVVSGIFYALMA